MIQVELTKTLTELFGVDHDDPRTAAGIAEIAYPGFTARYIGTGEDRRKVFGRCEACNTLLIEGDSCVRDSSRRLYCGECFGELADVVQPEL